MHANLIGVKYFFSNSVDERIYIHTLCVAFDHEVELIRTNFGKMKSMQSPLKNRNRHELFYTFRLKQTKAASCIVITDNDR